MWNKALRDCWNILKYPPTFCLQFTLVLVTVPVELVITASFFLDNNEDKSTMFFKSQLGLYTTHPFNWGIISLSISSSVIHIFHHLAMCSSFVILFRHLFSNLVMTYAMLSADPGLTDFQNSEGAQNTRFSLHVGPCSSRKFFGF